MNQQHLIEWRNQRKNILSLHKELNASIEDCVDTAYLAGFDAGKQDVIEELQHEQKKLLDGFSHPKYCEICLKNKLDTTHDQKTIPSPHK